MFTSGLRSQEAMLAVAWNACHLFYMNWSLFDLQGQRKYLTANERRAFIAAAGEMDPKTATFCLTVAYTGCRISEALMLTSERIDIAGGAIIIETLKRRRHGIFRAVPMPMELIAMLSAVHGLEEEVDRSTESKRLWTFSRTTAWKRIKLAMQSAGVSPRIAKPKALRHAFAVEAVRQRIALSLVRKWLGHARLDTTVVYADATGEEERALASLMWRELASGKTKEGS